MGNNFMYFVDYILFSMWDEQDIEFLSNMLRIYKWSLSSSFKDLTWFTLNFTKTWLFVSFLRHWIWLFSCFFLFWDTKEDLSFIPVHYFKRIVHCSLKIQSLISLISGDDVFSEWIFGFKMDNHTILEHMLDYT